MEKMHVCGTICDRTDHLFLIVAPHKPDFDSNHSTAASISKAVPPQDGLKCCCCYAFFTGLWAKLPITLIAMHANRYTDCHACKQADMTDQSGMQVLQGWCLIPTPCIPSAGQAQKCLL